MSAWRWNKRSDNGSQGLGRRQLLQGIASSAVLGCAGHQAEPISVHAASEDIPQSLKLPEWGLSASEHSFALRSASRSPSRHNAQYWKLSSRSTILKLHFDWKAAEVAQSMSASAFYDGQSLGKLSAKLREKVKQSYISMGFWLKSAEMSYSSLGMNAELSLEKQEIHRVESGLLKSKQLQAQRMTETMPRRYTCAEPMGKLDASQKSAWKKLLESDNFRGTESLVRIRYIEDPGSKNFDLRGQLLKSALGQIGDDDAQRELSRWIHRDDEVARKRGDGYSLDSLGISGMARFYLQNFAGDDIFLGDKARDSMKEKVQECFEKQDGFLVIDAANSAQALSPLTYLSCGDVLSQLWLQAHYLDIGIQPISSPYEMADDKALKSIAGESLMVLRVGKLTEKTGSLTLRKQPSQILR